MMMTLLPAEPEHLFTDVVQPALKKDCEGCHGTGQVLANLDLRTREGLLKGGMRGPAITPGKAEASLLYKAIAGIGDVQMPPGGPAKRLPAATIAAVKDWINAGAPWTTAASRKAWDYKPEDLWAFRPLRKPPIPPQGAPNPIDAFLNARLREKGLKAAGIANRETLMRRASIDLTGLPPTPEETAAFVNDKAPDAYARLIDRLLESPRYGERWGRHWLDVARYADTGGYSNDFERPNAWRYRDYVIRAFNNDKPYDQFIREQIAGDEIDPRNPENLIAVGFLRAGPWEHTAMSVEAVTRQLFLDDVTNSVGVTFLGLTLGCARCHDHKFDPIPTKDYYGVQAIFATTEFARRPVEFLAAENVRDIPAERAYMKAVLEDNKRSMDSFDIRVRENVMRKHGVSRVEELPKGVLQAALREKEGIRPDEFEQFKLYQKHQQIYRESQDRYEARAFSVSSGPLDGYTDGGQNVKYPQAAQYKPPVVHVLPGGNIQSPAEAVTPSFVSAVTRYSGLPEPALPQSVAGRRKALADWIADPRNPLTARIMVNRIWQYHFGKGIAADTSNFGKMGHKPSHPELLDYLAATFIEKGWSVKAMHRMMMLSDAYQRASTPADAGLKTKDPENALLSYYPPRRVEAEVLRDSILAVAGELSPEAGGPGVYPQINDDVMKQPRHAMGSLQPLYQASPLKRQRNRRTVYAFQQRSLIDPMVEVFNGPTLDLSCERREASTVPTQAFALFNGQFVHDMALAMAARLEKEGGALPAQVERAFRLAFNRKPGAEELQMALQHIQKQTEYHRKTPPPSKSKPEQIVHTIVSELTGEKSQFVQKQDTRPYEANLHPSDVAPGTRALADFALVLLNANEFVYVY
ncbi:MAG: PSD1 domain-containing protein [Acidobacteria bacterium]|nr:PSD1 domain-containing protein [Acidobacteriota bacterium]